jgi:hypothetical protein
MTVMRSHRAAVALGSLFAINIGQMWAGWSEPSKQDLVRYAQEASGAAIQNLQSGKGTGVFEYFEQTKDQSALVLKSRARITANFDRGKYYVRLEYENKDGEKLVRRIIICDGSAVFSSCFWEKIQHPTGAEGYIHPAEGEIKRATAAKFPLDVSCLAKQILDVNTFFKNISPDLIAFEKRAKRYYGTYPVNKTVTGVLVLDPEANYNVVENTITNAGERDPAQKWLASWKQLNNVWVITDYAEQLDLRPRGLPLMVWKVSFDKFEPNCTIDKKLFHLDSLELPKNSRLLDQRRNANERTYYYDSPKETDSAHLDTMVAQLQTLPTSPVARTQPFWLTAWFWSLNAFGVLLAGLGLTLRWRRARRIGVT